MSGPDRTIILTDGSSEQSSALVDLVAGETAPLLVSDPAGLSALAGAGPGTGVLVGRLPDAAADGRTIHALQRIAEAGGSVVVLASALADAAAAFTAFTGSPAAGRHPLGEWIGKVPLQGPIPTLRLPAEVPVHDELVTFSPSGGTEVLLSVSIAFTDRPVVLERRIGQGRVVVAGVGTAPGSLRRSPDLVLLLRRCLRPLASEGRVRGAPFGLAVLGYGPYGGMGLYHGLAAQATQGLHFAAAADSDPGRRKAAEEEFPGVSTYATAEELAADEEVDVVVVATPPVSHFALAHSLIAAGKHVVLEKPMCLTLEEADRLIEAAATHGRSLTVHQSRRFDPDYLAVRQAIGSGALGEVFNVETFVGGFDHPCRAWHSERSVSGGAVYDWGSHHLDWILQLMGDFPTGLVAHGHKRVWRDVTNLDQVRVRLTWPDGREAEFLQSDVAAVRRPKFFVQGTSGTLAGWYRPLLLERLEPGIGYVGDHAHHAEAPAELTLARHEPGLGLTETRLAPPRVERFAFHRNLADHLQLGEPLAVTPESARRVVALLEAAQRSTDEGNVPVQLPVL